MKYFTNLDQPRPLPAEKSRKALSQILEIIQGPLFSVEEHIRAQAREFDPAVEAYVSYACDTHGKRLRPSLALLAAGATGKISENHIDLAVVLELIHAATLVHDDIMDGAEIRRGQPTTNAKWGNAISVLLGDCLFAHALKLSTRFSNPEISRRIANAVSEVCTGEIIQTQRRFDLKLGAGDYFRIIEMKTAALFGVACELGAFLNDAPPPVVSALKTFGLKLGTAYQIYDDCIDIAGDETAAGKTLGSDLRKGKLTLPILNLLREADDAHRQQLSERILRGDADDVEFLSTTARDQGAMAHAVESALNLLRDAELQIAFLPPGNYVDAMRELSQAIEQMLGRFSRD